MSIDTVFYKMPSVTLTDNFQTLYNLASYTYNIYLCAYFSWKRFFCRNFWKSKAL